MGKEDLVMRMRRLVFDVKVEKSFSSRQKDEFTKCLPHFAVCLAACSIGQAQYLRNDLDPESF